MPKSDPYVCPRCLYETSLKKNMKKHLYDLKKTCSNKQNVTLTDEIRNIVLECHHYYPVVVEATSVTPVQTVPEFVYNRLQYHTNIYNTCKQKITNHTTRTK